MAQISNPFEFLTSGIGDLSEQIKQVHGKLADLEELVQTPNSNRLLTKQQVADILNIHVNTVDNLRRSGKLSSVKLGKVVRLRESDLEDLMTKRQDNAACG
jgi:excisionase family DNA binding protein